MALIVKDENGNIQPLEAAAVAVGIGTTDIGRQFEVAGLILSRENGGENAVAATFSSDEGANGKPQGTLGTNAAYDPKNPFKGFKRTINMMNGSVGIGDSDAAMVPSEKLVVEGNILATGDVRLTGADCAEEFDIDERQVLEPGAVMVIGDDERLRQSSEAYDTKVAGVLSGAGDCKPGIVLGRRSSTRARAGLALTGKVYCKVDAAYSPIAIGDLLTTSPTHGHAMKVSDPTRALGAILGKALRPLSHGKGLVPILVALQ